MSTHRRRFAASSMVVGFGVVALASGSAAQSPGDSPVAPGTPLDTRCAAWQSPSVAARSPGSSSWTVRGASHAARPGIVTSALEATESIVECTFSRESVEHVKPRALRDLIGELGIGELHVAGDGGDDFLSLDGSAVEGTPDPALDMERILFGTGDLDRAGVRRVARLLGSDRISNQLDPTFGRPPADLIEQGEWQIIVIYDLADDPAAESDTSRYWQLAIQGTDPDRNVAPTIPVTSTLSGTQHLLTYGRFPQEGGGTGQFVGRSNFGVTRLGPDQQTQYYNTRANFAVFIWQDGVAFLFPGDLNPLAFRPMTFDQDTNAWDIGAAPGGPLALFPVDGSAPGMYDFATLILKHSPTPGGPVVVDGVSQETARFPSGMVALVDPNPVLDLNDETLWGIEYAVLDHHVKFEQLPGQPLAGLDMFAGIFGIPQHGIYRLDQAVISQAVDLPDSWDQTGELTRSLGTSRWTVDTQPGMLHDVATWAWAEGQPPAPRPFDPEAARRMLDEAGWRNVEDP